MNTLLSLRRVIPTCLMLLAVLLGVAWLSSGCATSPRARAYQTLYTVGHGTDAAVKSYFDLVVARQVPTNGVPRVARSYESFQVAFRTALALAQFNPTAPAPSNVTAQAAQVLQTITQVKGQP